MILKHFCRYAFQMYFFTFYLVNRTDLKSLEIIHLLLNRSLELFSSMVSFKGMPRSEDGTDWCIIFDQIKFLLTSNSEG